MNANYQIFVDSTVDLPEEKAQNLGLAVIPFIFTLDGKDYHNYLDYRDLPVKTFYQELRNGKVGSTTQITALRYKEAWEPYVKEGKDILYLCLSAALSKSYEQSLIAVDELKSLYPDRKIISIDTKSASLGIGILVSHAAKARDEGAGIDENAKLVEGMIQNLHHWIMADDLHHLRRGGRVSGAAAFVGTMLNVKPILTILTDGRVTPVIKVRGRHKAIEAIIKKMKEYNFDPAGQIVAVAHSDVPEFANRLKDAITNAFGKLEFLTNEIGPLIGCHTGPGTLAAAFIADPRSN